MAVRAYGAGNLIRDVLLNVENVSLVAVVGLRPNVVPALRIVQLHRHPQSLILPAYAALEDRTDVQLLCDRANILRLPLELKRRCARHNAHAVEVGKSVRQFLSETIAEVLNLRVSGQVDEWQDNQRVHTMVRLSHDADSARGVNGEHGDRRNGKYAPDPR